MSARRADELRLAFLLLTRLPVAAIPGAAPTMAASSWAWPIVGLVVGGIAGALALLCLALGLTPLMAALAALAVGALLTGAMHEDGLADLADGFGGGRDRDRKLEIMRDSRIGSYGVLALVLATGFRAAGISALATSGGLILAFPALAAASRAALPAALVLLPPARTDGLGRAATGTEPRPAAVAALIGFACLLPFGVGVALAVTLVIAGTAAAIAVLAMRQIGGQTGDVLGAMQVLCECAGWATLVAFAI